MSESLSPVPPPAPVPPVVPPVVPPPVVPPVHPPPQQQPMARPSAPAAPRDPTLGISNVGRGIQKGRLPSLAYGSIPYGNGQPTNKLYVPGALDESLRRDHVCPAPGCPAAYSSASGLYQHKRSHHPELINSRAVSSEPYGTYEDEDERRFACPACDKCYSSSQGIYQHKRAKHPWLIKERARGYTRPEMRKNSD